MTVKLWLFSTPNHVFLNIKPKASTFKQWLAVRNKVEKYVIEEVVNWKVTEKIVQDGISHLKGRAFHIIYFIYIYNTDFSSKTTYLNDL